ncbi:MAG: hypothetical protein KBD52_00060 [Candidatus Pacebacteria bacterium]|nr:hypothetical protein [Candidatus Paceibacterota bacterium]
MSSKIKNIIIFVGIGLVLVVLYIVLFSKTPEEENFIVSTTQEERAIDAFSETLPDENSQIAQEFLAELLSIKSLQLDDSILGGIVFASLKDPDVLIIQDEKEGRPNPFAPIGFGATPSLSSLSTPTTTPTPITPTTTTKTTTTTGNTTPILAPVTPVTPSTPTTPTTPSTTNPPVSPTN